MSKPIVEKIGGTSMSRFGELLDTLILRDPKRVYGRVYVVSAYGGVTNELLEHKKSGVAGVYGKFAQQSDYREALHRLGANLREINQGFAPIGLNVAVANAFIDEKIELLIRNLKSMADVLASGYLPREAVLLAGRELLASLGEVHSAFNSANILQSRGINAQPVDLSGWDDARQITIDERIEDALGNLDMSDKVAFVTGYCKGTEGIMREFDRGYSEVTFSKVAVHMRAAEAVIHKEFHLCSADPKIVGEDRVRPVCNTNFDVADQLADVGMEAIHPKASKPLERAGIPIRVRNAFDPAHDGTLITKDYIGPESRTEIIAGSDRLLMVEIHDAEMVAQVGFDLKLMQTLARHNISYVTKATNANTIGMTIWEKDGSDALAEELGQQFDLVTVWPVAIVCAIGSNIAKPGILAHAAKALAEANINIIAVSQTARQTNIQFVVSRSDFIEAQRALHRELCE